MEISAVLRILAFVLLLISLIVIVTDKTRSDVLFSFNENIEGLKYSFSAFEAFRFVVAANVIGFLYSFIRIILGFCPTIDSFCLHLSFIFDQVMAYILLSSASAGIAYIMFIRDSFEGQQAYGVAERKFLSVHQNSFLCLLREPLLPILILGSKILCILRESLLPIVIQGSKRLLVFVWKFL
ncbi:hypothetical protein SUGI_0478520 [Cryptomeria japonica]|nr:hypothetical protein SUGI_0478520 [Cryptomeria japonica]